MTQDATTPTDARKPVRRALVSVFDKTGLEELAQGLHAAGVTLAVVAWGYLVWAAIDFGSSARDGDGRSWFFLGLAALGAVACLFAGLMLVARLARSLGLLADPTASAAPPRHGGRRASR